ncbi:MAG: hypothetical protein HY518_03740, partial [Candidatus Aenigmarchaeota archaeon]|nr:hypothetical protein [Candidatus Aenigmarchaeota archaeon]
KRLIVLENTIFHIFGSRKLPANIIAEISYRHFSGMTGPGGGEEKKLILLKTLLQSTGWGDVRAIKHADGIAIRIRNPPYGLQAGGDNRNFLAGVILGYLWMLDKDYRLDFVKEKPSVLAVGYSKGKAVERLHRIPCCEENERNPAA